MTASWPASADIEYCVEQLGPDLHALGRGLVRLLETHQVGRLIVQVHPGEGIARLLRLLRPLDRREKLFSLIVAVGHLAVACTVVLDYRFIVILLASLILLPRSLVELESESFTGNGGAVPRPGFASQLAVLAVMVAVFLVLPRGLLGGPIAARLPGSDASVNRLDSMLDPARSGAANSSRVLFQVDAAEVGYLKMMAMVDFENGQWEADELMFNWRPIHQPRPDWTDAHDRRRDRKSVV